jgi:signal transduction histidine kinase
MAVARRQIRSRPIRLLLAGMLIVPLVSLIALWGFAADVTITNAVKDHNVNAATEAIAPNLQPLLVQLSTERAETYAWMNTARQPDAALGATRHRTDQVARNARGAFDSVASDYSPQGRAGLSELDAALGQPPRIRAAVDSGAMSPTAAFQAYNGIVDAVLRFITSAPDVNDGTIYQATTGGVEAIYAMEMAGREVALVGPALAADRLMDFQARQLFANTVALRLQKTGDAYGLLNQAGRAAYANATDSANYRQLTAMETQIAADPGTRRTFPVAAAAWQSSMNAYLAAMQNGEGQQAAGVALMSAQLSDRLVTEAVLAGGLGLAAVVITAVLLLWLGRRVNGELTGLLGSVRAMAEERLPRVVERLRRGEEVDVAAESPPPHTGTIREVARVAEAFSVVQGAAVVAAVDQAKLRKGVSQVFLNLSMRNQSLLHRQLSMLDAMERRASDPDALADLFRLDHLTTRMRRHAEGLIILAGVAPGRGWRDPVPVVDVLRAAIAEVEDYVRVDMMSESRDMVIGTAVSDVIHLVAELVENAAAFSPPETRIEVRADRVGSGLVAEIEDRGLGLSQEQLDGINQRLASPPEFDLADSSQLGLFIVGRLAARHGIKVALRHSPYGGITAIVLLPNGVAVREEDVQAPAATAGRARGEQTGLPGAANGTPASHPADRADDQGRTHSFGPTGRHRMAALPLPRSPRPPSPAAAEPERPAGALRPSPAAPWDIHGQQPAGPDETGPAPVRPGPASTGSHLGMPVRVPQASIAPQLRAQAGKGPDDASREAAGPSARSPEATRAMLLSMQHGWQRGRLDDLGDPGDAPRQHN